MCEMCGEEQDHLYNADGLADIVGEVPTFDDSYNLCADCLNKIESAVSLAWRSKVEKTESEVAEDEMLG